MTTPQTLAADLRSEVASLFQADVALSRALDDHNLANAQVMPAIEKLVAELDSLPVAASAVPIHGADPSKIDWERPPLTTLTAKDGLDLEGVQVNGRILHGNAREVRLKDVYATGGPALPTSPRPIIDASASACEGWIFEGVTVEPKVRSVMWSEGLRVGRLATISRLLIRGTVDGLAVVTPTGRRTGLDLEDFLCEDLFWSATDPNHADGTHNDPIQFHGSIDSAKMRRLILRAGTKGTACIMANVPSVTDFHLSDSDLSISRAGKAGANFGPTTKVSGTLAAVDTHFDCPVDVYCRDELAAVLRLDRSTRADGSMARRSRS